MAEIVLRVRAPFAAFRPFQAGTYRSTAPVMPPSVAYGLLLNLAGIDSRDQVSLRSASPTSLRHGMPGFEIAVGTVSPSEACVTLQQLHSYPVGGSGKKELAPRTHGAKFWIAPVKREVLVGYDGMIAGRAMDDDLCARIRSALSGSSTYPRYGLPFAGDNNFLVDRLEEVSMPAEWYVPCDADAAPARRSCRLTLSIDRADSSRTRTLLFAPAPRAATPPQAAFVRVP